MKKGKLGFTLIEVSIFLAITGVLFVGVTVGVQTSINQQRYNDAVQNFMEFLRSTYSSVSNVQSVLGRGNSEKAIYGKMVTFGESYNLAGDRINPGDAIFSYTVIGNIGNSESGNVLQSLKNLDANVVVKNAEGELKIAGLAESYVPRWSSQIEVPCSGDTCEYKPFTGTLLIVRHPSSGTVYTFYSPDVAEVNRGIKEGAFNMSFDDDSFEMQQIDFCVNQNPGVASIRGDVRIMKGARNASGVELIPEEEGVCRIK